MMKSIFKYLGLLIVSLVLSYAFLGFYRLQYGEFIGEGHDSFVNLGFMHLAKQNIANGKWPYSFTDNFRYTSGFHFECGYDGFLPITFGALLSFIASPSNAFNASILVFFALNI